jgi:hypothetical protein
MSVFFNRTSKFVLLFVCSVDLLSSSVGGVPVTVNNNNDGPSVQ